MFELFDDTNTEVPSLDDIPPSLPDQVNTLKSCILNRLRRQCGKLLMGPWAEPNNITIEQMKGGLSNYLYMGVLKPDIPSPASVPRKVLIRVYGELMRNNMNSVVLDSVIFALLSEKKIGPRIYGVFPGGRIEEYVESRTLSMKELSLPPVSDSIALHMGVLHSLTLPLPKLPTFVFKMLAKFLQQLTGTRELLSKPHPEDSNKSSKNFSDPNVTDEVLLSPSRSLINSCLFGSTSSISSIPEPQTHLFLLTNEWKMVEEFDWLRSKFFQNMDRFPVTFCHNDIQENNILLYKESSKTNCFRLLPIDFEYSGYNFRAIDIGNFFNEWTFQNSSSKPPGYEYMPDAYPSHERQIDFWRKYLTIKKNVEDKSIKIEGYVPDQMYHCCSSSGDSFGCNEETIKMMSNGSTRGLDNAQHIPENLEINLLSELNDLKKLTLVELTPEEEKHLITETTYGALFSHIWWAAWSLIQSKMSNIEFGFLDYAKTRMQAYYKLKGTLPSSEFVDGSSTNLTFAFSSQESNNE